MSVFSNSWENPIKIVDPGGGGTIPADNSGVVELIYDADNTGMRVLPVPTFIGQTMLIFYRMAEAGQTVVLRFTVVPSGAFYSTFRFNRDGGSLVLFAVMDGSNIIWRFLFSTGVSIVS